LIDKAGALQPTGMKKRKIGNGGAIHEMKN